MRADSKLGLHLRSTFLFAHRGTPGIINALREEENISWAPIIGWLVARSGTNNQKFVKTASAVASDTKVEQRLRVWCGEAVADYTPCLFMTPGW